MRHDTSEPSVLISLRELVALEDERLREERAEEAARVARELAAEQAREEARRAAEEERVRAEEAERAERRRREAEEAARLRALEAAEVERVRAAKEKEAELELRKTELAHQEVLRRMELEGRQRRSRRLVGAGIVVSVLAAVTVVGLAVWSNAPAAAAPGDPAAITPAHRQLHDQRLAALDRVHAQLRDQQNLLDAIPPPLAQVSEEVARARNGLAAGTVTDVQLDAFEQSLEKLRASLLLARNRQHLASLDAIHAELKAAVARVRYPGAALKTASEEAAAARARIGEQPDEPGLRSFSRALQVLTKEAGSATPGGRRLPSVPTPDAGPARTGCDPHDPMCFDLP